MKRMLFVVMSLGLVSPFASAQDQPSNAPSTPPATVKGASGERGGSGRGGYGGGGYGRGAGGYGGSYEGGAGGYGEGDSYSPGGGYGDGEMSGYGYGSYGPSGRGGGMGGGGMAAQGNKFDPRQTRKLIEQWKASKDEGERDNVEESMREMLQAEFSARMAGHEKEIKQLEEKVRQLRERLNLRREKQSEIVENRLQQLLRDAQGLGWGAEG